MNDLVFITLVVTGFTVAFLHAAIPTHWLPFVVAARAQHWKKPKTLAVTGVAGAGHVLFTIALGVLVVWGGMAINSRIVELFHSLPVARSSRSGFFILCGKSEEARATVICSEDIHIISTSTIHMILTRTRTLALVNMMRTLKNMSRWTNRMISQR